MFTYYPADQLDTDMTATVTLDDDVLGAVVIEANVPVSMAVELQLVNRLRELYPNGIGAAVYSGSVLDVTCGLMMRHYASVSYQVTRI